LFLQFPGQRALRQRAAEGEIGMGGGRGLRERGNEIRHEAETLLHVGEDLLLVG